MNRDDIIRMAREAGFKVGDNLSGITLVGAPNQIGLSHLTVDELAIFAALVAAAEQKPISDVTEAVTKTVIETEKLLCEKIGRQWQPSGMSIRTLVDELATLVAAAEREACAEVAENGLIGLTIAKAIRARGEP